MTYQGARARPEQNEDQKTFAVWAVRLDNSGHIARVLWSEVTDLSRVAVGGERSVPVSDVVDAIHDGASVLAMFEGHAEHLPAPQFEVTMHPDGSETIVLLEHPALQAVQASDLGTLAAIEGART